MKFNKKLVLFIATALMAFHLFPVMASADSNSPAGLTIHGKSSSYTAYEVIRIGKVTSSNGSDVYADATVVSEFKSTLVSVLNNIDSDSNLSDDSTDNDILKGLAELDDNSINVAKLADALSKVETKPTSISISPSTPASLKYGYYLVTDTGESNNGEIRSRPILVGVPELKVDDSGKRQAEYNVSINVKPATANLTKKIEIGDDGISTNTPTKLVDSSLAAKGSTLYYRTLSDFPTYSEDMKSITYKVTDTYSSGLTFGGIDSVQVIALKSDYNAQNPTKFDIISTLSSENYSFNNSEENNFSVTLIGDNKDPDVIDWGNQGYKLLIKYHLILNDNATFGSTGNPNSAKLTYSVNPEIGDTDKTTEEDTVITYINKLAIHKMTDSNPSRALSGAGFTLYKSLDGGNTWSELNLTATTGENGTAVFDTLTPGTLYKISETTVPSGYGKAEDIQFKLSAKNGADSIPNINIVQPCIGNSNALNFTADWSSGNDKIKIEPNDGTLEVEIVDHAGYILPGTGGIGTRIFFAAGTAILLLGGSLALIHIRKRRKPGIHYRQ